jgi:hypothetical protein
VLTPSPYSSVPRVASFRPICRAASRLCPSPCVAPPRARPCRLAPTRRPSPFAPRSSRPTLHPRPRARHPWLIAKRPESLGLLYGHPDRGGNYLSRAKLLPEHVTLDNAHNDWDFVHVLRAIQFSATIRDWRKNLGEPVNLPSAWPILYNSFFEIVRADSFRYSPAGVDIRRAFILCLRYWSHFVILQPQMESTR